MQRDLKEIKTSHLSVYTNDLNQMGKEFLNDFVGSIANRVCIKTLTLF